MRRLIAAFLAAIGAFILFSFSALPAAGATVCQVFNGCTGTSTLPAFGAVLVGGPNGEYEFVATSTFGGGAEAVSSVFGRTGAITAQSGDYTTSEVPEGTNLYYTAERVQALLDGLGKGYFFSTTSAAYWQSVNSFFSTTSAAYWLGTRSTSDLAEGSNLYWTDARFDGRLAATTSLPNIAALPGLSLPYSQVTGAPDLAQYLALNAWYATTTDQLREGTGNLYFTDARAVSALTGQNVSIFSNDAAYLTPTSVGGPFYTLFHGTTTDALPEGAGNLYFTESRADARFVTDLAATSSVKSITTLPSLSLPYTQLTSTPAIPRQTSDLTNDSGFITGVSWGSITGTLSSQTDLQTALNAKQGTLTLTTSGTTGAATLVGSTLNIPQYAGTTYAGTYPIIVSGSTISTAISTSTLLSLGAWFSTTTDQLAEGASHLYFTNARADARFVSDLAATTSVKSIATLPSLSLPYSQLIGTPAIASSTLLSDNNTFSGTNTFSGSNAFGTPASITLTNATGLLLASGVTGLLPIANGGTNAGSHTTNGVAYFDGTKLTTGSVFQFNGTKAGVGALGSFALFNVTGTKTGIGGELISATKPDETTAAACGFGNDASGFMRFGAPTGSRFSLGACDLTGSGDPRGKTFDFESYNSFDFTISPSNFELARFATSSPGGVNAMGIGTTSPWGKLSVTNTGTGPSFVVEDSASPDQTPFIIDAVGSVGIGTTSPSQTLDVNGSINIEGGTNGVIMHDTATSNCYLLQVTNGALALTSHACQ